MNDGARRPSRWWPHPLTSALLFLAWLWLNNSLHPGHVLLAALAAFAIPLFTWRFWPAPVRIRRPLALLAYLGLVLYDVVVANLQVAAVILGPAAARRPAFVRVPLRVRDELVITALAATVTLTPGTVSVEVEGDGRGGRVLLVHCLRCEDPAALVEQVRQRYEARLMEIFG